ncbi:DUF2804 domain-containing protein [Suttonella sp. R2A3]|uniref:DUF2804 domain-containing protein n=1 Tax=Suttonella sp. R2A3 TaxID=2908648 RepID=UPI001F4730F4|nr:DUF2804 domain-containing protein [Suttonella sp. R2A3]UJF24036.1 DUF2804 domain-containing protein [Suttonella sp. R2A3]
MDWDKRPNNLSAPSGRFEGAIDTLSTKTWDSWWRRRLQRKAWVYAGVHTDTLSIGFSIADAGLLGNAFVYVYEREHGLLTEHQLMRPLAFASNFAPTPHAPWQLKNRQQYYRWQPTDDHSSYLAEFSGDNLTLHCELTQNNRQISALNRLLDRPFQYTEKNIGLSSKITLDVNGRHYEYSSNHGVLDFSLGYPPRHTHWQWVCLSGTASDGRTVGINAVAQFFNGLENTLWLGDAPPKPLPQMIFHYDPNAILDPWRMHSADQRLALTFYPEGMREESIQLGVFSSHFQQPFGYFTGEYINDDGATLSISGYGVVEQHRTVW